MLRVSTATATFTVLAALLCACAGPSSDDDNVGDDTDTAGDGDGDPSGDGDPTTTTSGDGDGDGDPDPTGGACTLWVEDDCMDPKLKCMPWSEQPDRIPDTTKCCDLDGSPVSLGDRCNTIDYDGSCLDNCPVDTMCVIDQLDALEGYCQTFCSVDDPSSCPPTEVCKPFFELIETAETVPLCMSRCDPLVQDCESKGRPGWSCLPEGALSPSFLCMPPIEAPKQEYAGCLLANDCEVGLACVPASEVLGCSSLFNCCTQYCDTSDPVNPCTMGNECVNLDSDVPGLENVGVCADPL
jgi:hypothetical protein